MFDIVIIGGNIAGVFAAITAAQKNVNVALVEKNKEPLSPAHCGEGVTDICAQWLGLDGIGCPQNKITNIHINIASPKGYTFKLVNHHMIVFNRNYLEKELLREAGKQGVELLLGTRMTDFNPPHEILLDNHNKIEGKIIIDASGIACQIGRRIGVDTRLKPEDIGVCMQSRVQSDFPADTVKVWFHHPYAPFGYAWLFPLNNHLANIGIGSGIGAPRGQKVDMGRLLERYINDSIQGSHTILSTFSACVPSAPPLKRIVKDNVLIVGDAARLAHPLSGGGIRNAFFSGRVAGVIAARYIHGEIPSLETYQDVMQQTIAKLRKQYAMKAKVFNTEQRLVRNYRMLVSTSCVINHIIPSLFQRGIARVIETDKALLESCK